ncbi:MAG: hypothetical protein BWK79_15325 [Beggiatoa sp. IS2]|nr:MAG: hypothetical protein BWK79_15325 [Beggiatoa sp. IS2]
MRNFAKIVNKLANSMLNYISISWLVFIIALVATLSSWFIVKQLSQQQIKSNIFEYRVERIENAITYRILAYQQMLQGAVSLFNASILVERHEWHDYVHGLYIGKYYPGIQGIGFSKYILPQDKEAHTAEVRTEGGLFQNYTIKPEGEREEYTSIVYLEPLDRRNQQAIGFDMFSEPVRHTAMVRARDTGKPALSGKVTLVQEIDEDVQAGFLLYIPLYRHSEIPSSVAERRKSLVGYVYSPFRINDLMRGIFGNQQFGIDFHIYDSNSSTDLNLDRLMYDEVTDYQDENTHFNYSPQFTQISQLVIAGHTWTIRYVTLPNFETVTKTHTANVVLLGGLVVAFLLFGVTRSFEIVRLLVTEQQANIRLQGEIRERQQVEQALQDNQKQLYMITDNIPAFIAYVDSNQIYRFVNKRYEEWFGLPLSDIVGQSVRQVKGDASYYGSIKNHVETVLSGKPTAFETILPHQDGKEHWVQGKYFPDINSDGIVDGYFALMMDVTEHKQMELALHQSEERFELAMLGANDGLWDWNTETNEVYFSPRWKAMLGYEDHEIQHHLDEWVQRVHPDDLDNTMADIGKYFAQETPLYENIHRVRHKEGHYIWILDRGLAMRNFEGKPIRMVGTHTDLTALKQTEEALRHSEEKFRQIVETAQEGIWMIDAEANTTYVNTTMSKMLGYAEAEMLGKHLFCFMDEPAQVEASQYLKRRQQGIGEIHDFRFCRKDGSDLWTMLSTTVITDKTGHFTGSLAMIADITHRKQVELDLQQAKEAAEVANRAKSIFLANMSHELRTPLNGILGYTQILNLDHGLTEDQRQSIRIIEKSGEYLLTLINDILDLAKVESGKIELSPEVVQLDGFIRDVILLFRSRVEQKNVMLSYQPLSELPVAVYADETRLRQILINLLNNAVKFTEQGSIVLKISYDQEEKIHFQVEDTGCGILEEDLDRIFLPFHQVGEKKYQLQGTGLGLPITKKLVEMMGGELHVASALRQGSIFHVSLKLPQISGCPRRTNPLSSTRIIGYQGRRRSILIVDDSSINRLVLVKILNNIGFTTLEATNGQEAFDKVRENQSIDLIFIDLIMPELNGFVVIQQLRQLPYCQKTVLIAVSASAFESDRQQSIELGCNDFIAKPIKFDLLLTRLQTHLNLTYLYESTIPVLSSTKSNVFPEIPSIKLTKEQAIDLLELSKIGDIQGIIEYAENLEKLDEQLAPLSLYLIELSKNFKLKDIRKIAQQYVNVDDTLPKVTI